VNYFDVSVCQIENTRRTIVITKIVIHLRFPSLLFYFVFIYYYNRIFNVYFLKESYLQCNKYYTAGSLYIFIVILLKLFFSFIQSNSSRLSYIIKCLKCYNVDHAKSNLYM